MSAGRPENEILYVVYYNNRPASMPYATISPAKAFITAEMKRATYTREYNTLTHQHNYIRVERVPDDRRRFKIVEYVPKNKRRGDSFEF